MKKSFSFLSCSPVNAILALLTSLTLVSAPFSRSFAQGAGIVGVEHTGINVPDLPQAVQFFTAVLGFTPVTQMGPFPLDAAWKERFHMHAGTGPVTIGMVRAGTGANIELFQYQASAGSAQLPGGDDIGATHIAFYTTDIQASVAYLRSKGVKLVGKPALVPSGDNAGLTWVYFETPWGAKMELVSYPQGQAYEKANPKVKLWSPMETGSTPSPSSLNNTPLTKAQATKLIQQQLAIWNQQDASKRKVTIQKVYAPNLLVVDRHFVGQGPSRIDDFITDLQQQNPKSVFSSARPIETHHNVIRFYWQLGTATQPNAVTGMDLLVIENGKIQQRYVFVDEGGKSTPVGKQGRPVGD